MCVCSPDVVVGARRPFSAPFFLDEELPPAAAHPDTCTCACVIALPCICFQPLCSHGAGSCVHPSVPHLTQTITLQLTCISPPFPFSLTNSDAHRHTPAHMHCWLLAPRQVFGVEHRSGLNYKLPRSRGDPYHCVPPSSAWLSHARRCRHCRPLLLQAEVAAVTACKYTCPTRACVFDDHTHTYLVVATHLLTFYQACDHTLTLPRTRLSHRPFQHVVIHTHTHTAHGHVPNAFTSTWKHAGSVKSSTSSLQRSG